MNQKAMYRLTYGLFVLTANRNGHDNGCIINTAGQVTSEPNRISITVNKSNLTHDMVKETGNFTISILSQSADFELFERFGFHSGRDTDKFDGFKGFAKGANGINYVTEGTNAYISAKVIESVDLGTHTMFIAEVEDMEVLNDEISATYEYYQENIKPKPQTTPEGKTVWHCIVCGYEYVGEELPADFECPLCKHPASDFEKIVRQ